MAILVFSLSPLETGCLTLVLFTSGVLMDGISLLKSKTFLIRSVIFTSLSLVGVGAAYIVLRLNSRQEEARLIGYYAIGTLSVSQFILHIFHRKQCN